MSETIAVLEWHGWTKFLLPRVLGEAAVRRRVDPFRELPTGHFEELCRSASAVCFHVNLSLHRRLPLQIPDLTRRFVECGVHVVNGLIQDIRKSALHEHLEAIGLPSPRAPRSGPADEMLFVKTELNYGGETEKMIPPDLLEALTLTDLISPDLEANAYRRVRREELADAAWDDPSLVVERYISNPEDSFYRVYFSGKQVILVKAFDPSTIKKMSGDARDMNYLAELDALKDGSDELPISSTLKRDVATFLDRTPIEFGCIDVVHDGHESYTIVDLNPTPSAQDGSPDEELNRFLRLGITHPARRKPPVAPDSVLA